MKYSLLVFLLLILAGCVSESQDTLSPTEEPVPQVKVRLEDYGVAPELTNQLWLNTDRSLRLEDLRGKVVLLEMWTFG